MSDKPENERVWNTHSLVAFIAALLAGATLIALGHGDQGGVLIAFAVGIAVLPQPIRGDK